MAVFLTLPSTPIYSGRTNQFRLINPDVAPAPFDWLTFSAEVLGRESRPRLFLLTWARTEARRVAIARDMPNPPAGGTVADFCREYPVDRRTFERTVARACQLVAAKWNERNGTV